MTEKELMVEIYKSEVNLAESHLKQSQKTLVEGYKKLHSEHQNTVNVLMFAIEEAKIERKFKKTKQDILLANLKICRAENALDLGKQKATAELETAYNILKLDVERKKLWLQRENHCLVWAEAEKLRGFSQ